MAGTTRVYAVLSRSALAEGNPLQPYDARVLDLIDDCPIWILAVLEEDDMVTFLQFDEDNSVWVRTSAVHHREHVRRSIFAEFEINEMAMTDVQVQAAEDRAAIAVSGRVIVIHGGALHIGDVREFHRRLSVDIHGAAGEVEVQADAIALLYAPDVVAYADLPADLRRDCDAYLAAYIASQPAAPVRHAPKVRAAPPAAVARKQAPAGVAAKGVAPPPPPPQGGAPPPAPKLPPAPPGGKKAPQGPPIGKAPPGRPLNAPPGGMFGAGHLNLGRTSRPVSIKYTFQGELCQAEGVFINDTQVRWSDGSVTPWPPQWPGTLEVELHIGQPTGVGQRPPGHTEALAFDVFNVDSYLSFLEDDSVATLMNTIDAALRSESTYSVVDTVRMAASRRLLKKYLTSQEAEDIDLEEPSTVSTLRDLHLSFICAWAEQQGIDERTIVEYIEKKTTNRTNFVRQGIVEARGRGGGRRNPGRRGGRSGGRGGGRGGGRSGGPRTGGCYNCGGNHFQRDCPSKTEDLPDGTARGGRGGSGFRGGRGSGSRGSAARSHS